MKYEVIELKGQRGIWLVEAIGEEGEIYLTRFEGPNAEHRSREYAAFKEGQSKCK